MRVVDAVDTDAVVFVEFLAWTVRADFVAGSADVGSRLAGIIGGVAGEVCRTRVASTAQIETTRTVLVLDADSAIAALEVFAASRARCHFRLAIANDGIAYIVTGTAIDQASLTDAA